MHEQALTAWLGKMPLHDPSALELEVVAERDYKNYLEKKVIYRGHDGEHIPAYLLIPRGPSHPMPGIVAFHQCGYHCDIGKEQVVGKRVDQPDQAYGFELAQRGYVVLAPDAAKVGERYDPALREQWQCAFDYPSQDRCCCAEGGSWGEPRWRPVLDAQTAVSILQSQPEVDGDRLGAIGHSLGADTILWTLPFERRLKAVVLSGGGIIKVDKTGWMPYALPYEELLADVIAPQTAVFEFAGTRDPIHRLDEPCLDDSQKHMEKKRALFESLRSQNGRVELHTEDCGHHFHEHGRARAYAFLDRFLRDTSDG